MTLELLFIAVILLVAFAVFDLMVGVSNDAVNFLNSSIGSRVAPISVILAVAGLGILVGVFFSGGMMEVARKSIFHPQLFTMPELMAIFLAVMITDIILLDTFNTFGLPTSTTVSIVFELLGAAVAVSIIKVRLLTGSFGGIEEYINSNRALVIVSGILLSIVIAFLAGAAVQFLTRMLFTFDYRHRLRRYGALWGGVAMASITYFILVKGAKGATFSTPETVEWIHRNTWPLLAAITVTSGAMLHVLLRMGVNILKPIVIIGTFALALAFAANDLVNFIGVPMAGLHAYQAAVATSDPLSVTMVALAGQVRSESYMLLIAGIIMVGTLWFSSKARSVTETEVGLGRQEEEGEERFGSTVVSRAVVKMLISFKEGLARVIPLSVRRGIDERTDPSGAPAEVDTEARPSFDLVRAAVNLMVASAVVSYATSKKLPLSTTYVTFMVAMGTSFADRAWGRESAVYRVTGVLTVIGGWFMTALTAFTMAAICAAIVYFGRAFGVAALLVTAMTIVWKSYHTHTARVAEQGEKTVFNLKKIDNAQVAVATTFNHASYLVHGIRESLSRTLEGLIAQDTDVLRREKSKSKKFQGWANIITANIFKAMRLLQQQGNESSHPYPQYPQAVRRLQKMVDGHRDIAIRAHEHVSNHHKGLLDSQVEELREIGTALDDILQNVEDMLRQDRPLDYEVMVGKDKELRQIAARYNQRQVERIGDQSSKTRLSILFYAIVGNAVMLSKQNLRLVRIFEESFGDVREDTDFDLE